MPWVPMEMPSETVMVLKLTALPPLALMPLLAAGEVAEVHVAGSQVAWGAGNADLRLFEIGI